MGWMVVVVLDEGLDSRARLGAIVAFLRMRVRRRCKFAIARHSIFGWLGTQDTKPCRPLTLYLPSEPCQECGNCRGLIEGIYNIDTIQSSLAVSLETRKIKKPSLQDSSNISTGSVNITHNSQFRQIW